MSSFREVHRKIEGITFGMLSPSEIRRLSAVHVQTADTYDEDGASIPSGLMDGRLGTIEPRQRCVTCGNTAAKCPGHFGHIELAVPLVHVEFAKLVYSLLSAICRNCGRVLLSDDRAEQHHKEIGETETMLGVVPEEVHVAILREAKKNRKCPHCEAQQHKIDFSKPTTFHEIIDDGGVHRLTASIIRERFERIPDSDLEMLGFAPSRARPEWMILQVLPVPPVYVRPSITLGSGIRSEDDLTHKLVDIIRINERLNENIDAGAPTLIIQDLSELLQYHVTTYFNNTASGIPPARHRSGRALKTLSQRLKGKEGRFRSNLSGKRVDFSARTVISPDPNLDITEVGVPRAIAMRLSIPDKVTHWNLEEMKKLILNGPNKYPGALYIVRPDGKRIRLEFVVEREGVAEAILPGYIVERHLTDGDVVIFNRQPSLHRMSIMAHFVRVLPYKTFRLHLCVCPPYNADFDGDEMNLHVPQSEEAQTEARLLMQVQDQILSPRYGGPIIGAIRDFLSAAYLLTKESTLLSKPEVCSILSAAGYTGDLPTPTVKSPDPMWTGKQIFSLFLPKGFNYVLRASICRQHSKCLKEKCQHDAYVVVKDGKLRCGVIDKNSIGAERSESIYHRIVKDFGNDVGRRFMVSICRLVNAFLTVKGFSYGLGDLDLSKETQKKIRHAIDTAEENVYDLISKYQTGALERLPGQTLNESLEIFIMNELARARDKSGEIADDYFTLDNNGMVMTKTGARGSSLNIGQMTACVGQQSVRGKRILRGYRDRTLAHFQSGGSSPRACGFVYSSYRTGLDPIEFFFHAMGGREGLVDTAVRTQQSGYMQRRLINALEYLRVEYDDTVRDPDGSIVQFRYGEDGVDPAKSDHGQAVSIMRLVERVKLSRAPGKPASERYVNKRLTEIEGKLTPLPIEELRESIIAAKLNRPAVDQAISQAVEDYTKALVEPGEAVGIVAAQSIGEPGTQMTLRTFHYAGVKEQNVTLGLPRLIEIVDARRAPSTPIMTIKMKKMHSSDRSVAEKIGQRLVYVSIRDLTKSIYLDPERQAVVLELDKTLLKEQGVSPSNILKAIQLSDCEVSLEKNRIYATPTNLEKVDLKKLFKKLASMDVKGVPNIQRVLVSEEDGEWIIRTDGSNLPSVLEVPGVDPTRTVTNHIHEIAATLGIEAARNAIIREAKGVLEEQGLDVDVRHVMLVADVMTTTGEVRQIGRHGVSGEKSSILARAAFEITVPTLTNAAVRGLTDRLTGIAENVIIGQMVPVGTGLIDLYMGPPPKVKK